MFLANFVLRVIKRDSKIRMSTITTILLSFGVAFLFLILLVNLPIVAAGQEDEVDEGEAEAEAEDEEEAEAEEEPGVLTREARRIPADDVPPAEMIQNLRALGFFVGLFYPPE